MTALESGERARVSQDAKLAFAGQAASGVVTAITTFYLVRELGPEGYGTFSLAVSIGAIVYFVADFGLAHSTSRFMAERRGDLPAAREVLVQALQLKVPLTVAVAALIVAISGPVANAYDVEELRWALWATALAVAGQSVLISCLAALVAIGRLGVRLAAVCLESSVELAAIVGLVALGTGATGAAFGRGAAYVVGAAFGVLLVLRALGARRQHPSGGVGRRALLGYAGALLLIDAAYTLFERADVLIIGGLLGPEEAGFFEGPLRLITLCQYLSVALALAVTPRVAGRSREDRNIPQFLSTLRLIVIAYVGFAAILAGWADPIVTLALGADFSPSASVLRALAPYVFLAGLAPFLSLAVLYLGEARRRLRVAVGAVIANVAIDLALVPTIGILGAAIGTNVAMLLYVGIHLRICGEELGVTPAWFIALLTRALVAAGALAGLLALLDWGGLSVLDLAVGALGAPLVFLGLLVATGETRPAEIGQLLRRAARLKAP